MARQQGLPFALKRLLDRSVAAVGLVATAPLLGGALLASRLAHGRPTLFKQVRPGRYGEPFTIYKIRTMSNARTPAGELLPDGERLTKVGRVLRSTSLDELPQLWNVLRGDLSLVGPRPLLLEYLPLYSQDQRRRHDVLPGITGWAQVRGRNGVDWETRFADDLWYVDHWSLALDLKILALTVKKVLAREGVSAEGEATMSPFRGNA